MDKPPLKLLSHKSFTGNEILELANSCLLWSWVGCCMSPQNWTFFSIGDLSLKLLNIKGFSGNKVCKTSIFFDHGLAVRLVPRVKKFKYCKTAVCIHSHFYSSSFEFGGDDICFVKTVPPFSLSLSKLSMLPVATFVNSIVSSTFLFCHARALCLFTSPKFFNQSHNLNFYNWFCKLESLYFVLSTVFHFLQSCFTLSS